MGDMADFALGHLCDTDAEQLEVLGFSRVFQPLPEVPTMCPACGAGMVLRDGRYGPFWGCSAFPACKAGPTFTAGPSPLSEEEDHQMEKP